MTLRVGIIGMGQAGERHAIGFSAVPGVAVTAVSDLNESLAATMAQRFGATPFTDWRAMLDSGLDILVVALPHSMHVAPTEEAASRGIHVLMEKPLATTMDDGLRMLEACERAGVKLSVGFVHRFRDELQTARQWIQEGAIGVPQVGLETMNTQGGSKLPAWLQKQATAGGGVLMYGAIHGVDRLRWLIGSEVVSVSAQTHRFNPNFEVEESVSALLTFENGAIATLAANSTPYRAQPGRWETQINGSEGMLRIRTRQWAELSNDAVMERRDSQTAASVGEHYNFIRQAEVFVNAIREDTEPAITAHDGLKTLEICLAIYQSAAMGQPVALTN